MKIIFFVRVISFVGLVLSSAPLVVKYFTAKESLSETVIHFHVWFGIAFILFTITSMILKKVQTKKQ